MYTLVITVSKHDLTHKIAKAIAYRPEDASHSIGVVAPTAAESMDLYDVAAYGSAVHILQWMDETKSFLERSAEQLKTERIWAPPVGMNGVPKHVSQGPTCTGPALAHVLVVDKHTFASRYKSSLLPLHEHSVARFASVVEGDFRDQSKVEAQADSIAAELSDKD